MWNQGSEWNKWDLHVHVPGTVRANGYGQFDDASRDRFCTAIHESDVAVVGLTDYFRVETSLAVRRRFREMHGDSTLLLVNLELRLAAGGATDKADAHLLFNPELADEKIRAILARIPCLYSTPEQGSKTAHLSDFATDRVPDGLHVVDLGALLDAVGDENVLDVVSVIPAGKDGFTFATTSDLVRAKSAALRDRAHAVFGNPTDAARHRRERAEGSWRGPVFAGSDCHSWSDLENRLGKSIQGSDRDAHITWVKGEVSWEGLRQTIADPDNRVAIAPSEPERRRGGQVITKVEFPADGVYPSGPFALNPSLVAIIGARSSGKSSLLAQIAKSVDPEQTTERIRAAGRDDGPCNGHDWHDSEACVVTWGDDRDTSRGEIVYLPQDFVHQTAADTATVTERVKEAILRDAGELRTEWEQLENATNEASDELRASTTSLFSLREKVSVLKEKVTASESDQSLEAEETKSKNELASLDDRFALSSEDQETLASFRSIEESLTETISNLSSDLGALASAASCDLADLPDRLKVRFEVSGLSLAGTPDVLRLALINVLDEASATVEQSVRETASAQIADWQSKLVAAQASLDKERHAAAPILTAISAGATERQRITGELERLRELRAARSEAEATVAKLELELAQNASDLAAGVAGQRIRLDAFRDALNAADHRVGDIRVSAETGFSREAERALAQKMDRRSWAASGYVKGDQFDIADAQSDVEKFTASVYSMRIRGQEDAKEFAASVLSAKPELLLVGHLDGDRIGGLEPSQMSPGKASQFAFEVLIAGAPKDCPILLDQPEDDLDSRSIVSSVLPRIRDLRKTRQVLLVTHNANLVVGGDADQIVVADRAADVSGSYVMSFIAGPLEHSDESTIEPSIRERVCELLDGGEEAMERRLAQYRLGSL